MLRSLTAALAALAMSACEPDLPQDPPPTIVTAVFDPTTAQIPLPNDLVFLNPVNDVCPAGTPNVEGEAPACAQAELLATFSGGAPANMRALAGAFPSDQEVAITIDFVQTTFVNGLETRTAPDLDLLSITDSSFVLFATSIDGTPHEVPLSMLELSYTKGTDHGTLAIRNPGHQPWPPGAYSLVLRGGPGGVKTAGSASINVSASQVFKLVAQGKDMTDPRNLGLLRAQTGSVEAAIEQGRQLNQLIGLYEQTAFPAADVHFPHQEMAIATTFHIQPTVTNVSIDPGRSLVPLPIDLLRDPATGKLTHVAACALAGSSDAGNGQCASAAATAAAAGFLTLDGFSTTGAILGPTSDFIRAATVTPTSLLLYELTDENNPVAVSPTTFIVEPCEFTSGCGDADPLAPVIAIQPAGASEGDQSSVFRTRPLKDDTDYAIVMTTSILDKANKPLGSGTVANVLKFSNPVNIGGKSALLGIDDATTAALEKMRLQLIPVFAKLATDGIDRSKVAIAYTFHTQAVLKPAVDLAALPYGQPAATALPGMVTPLTPAEAFTKYGVPAGRPSSNIDEILETDITTFNLLDPATGAFLADPTKAVAETIHVLIATPKATNSKVPACPAALDKFGKCAPLMVFRHGLTRGRLDMLLVADSFAAAGMVTVAIDAAKHGDRAFCTSGPASATSGCNGGAACTTMLPAGAQGDASPPGTCGAAGFVKRALDGTIVGTGGNATDGIPAVSGNYLITANFFRTRDSMRQDLIDESQLVRAIAFQAENKTGPTGHSVDDRLINRAIAATGGTMIIDPFAVYYSGQSLGAIQGAMNVAANPRISKAAFNVGGGTLVDVFATADAFKASFKTLLMGLGIDPDNPDDAAKLLQFLVVGKTVLDPADPINFMGHLTSNTLPNVLVDPPVPQAAKKILSQIAGCDNTVPEPFGFVYAANAGLGPLPPNDGVGTFQVFTSAAPAVPGCIFRPVPHSFLTDFTNPTLTTTAQSDIADFVRADTKPPGIRQ